jgi:hypothetical protein
MPLCYLFTNQLVEKIEMINQANWCKNILQKCKYYIHLKS